MNFVMTTTVDELQHNRDYNNPAAKISQGCAKLLHSKLFF